MKINLSQLAEKVNQFDDSAQPPKWWLNGLTARAGHGNAQMVWLERAVGSRRYWVPVLQVGSAIVTEHLADQEIDRLVLQG
jgi:hypothetical protein